MLAANTSIEQGVDAYIAFLISAHTRLRCLLYKQRPLVVEADQRHALNTKGLASWLAAHHPRPRAAAMLLHRGLSSLVHPVRVAPDRRAAAAGRARRDPAAGAQLAALAL